MVLAGCRPQGPQSHLPAKAVLSLTGRRPMDLWTIGERNEWLIVDLIMVVIVAMWLMMKGATVSGIKKPRVSPRCVLQPFI